MSSPILTINAGSSSLKFALYDQGRQRLRGLVERIHEAPRLSLHEEAAGTEGFTVEGTGHAAVAHALLDWLEGHVGQASFAAVGHRVVHGGRTHDQARRVDAALLDELDELVPLAPLHQPQALAIIRQIHEHWPDLPQVACFDTAFHRTQPWLNQCYALPRQLTDEGIQRYGFHGLSYEYVIDEVRRRDDDAAADGRIIVAHLGNGASMAAIKDGRSVETTMGFSTLAGLPMGTRPGDLDPGVLLHLLIEKQMPAEALQDLLYDASGLLGISGLSRNMADLLARRVAPEAAEAIEFFCHHARRHLAGLTAALGGLDRLVFTGGIGANSPEIRARICDGLGYLGLALDAGRNAGHERVVSSDGSPVLVEAFKTDEELVIARHARDLLGASSTIEKTHAHG